MTMTLVDWSARISAIADALSVLDGGFSIDPNDGSDVRCGYAVAVHPEHERVFERHVTSADIHEYMAHAKALCRYQAVFSVVGVILRAVAFTWTFRL